MKVVWKRFWWTPLLLILLFLGALLPRVVALGYGLPYVEHVDEPALVEVVVRMVRNGDPNPHSFLYPSLCFYLFAAATRLHAWWGIRHGLYHSLQDLPLKTYIFTTSPGLYIWNRAVTAILGAAAIPVLYLLGRRMFDVRVGLLGAILLSVATFHVKYSFSVTTDAATGVWVALSLLGAWRIVVAGDWRGYVVGGIGAGLAAGTKYQAGVVALGVAVAHLLYWRRASLGRPLLRLVAGGVVSLATFVATTPFALLDWPNFSHAVLFDLAHYANGGHGDFVGRWQVRGYARFLWQNALLASGCLLTLAGLPVLARRFPAQTLLLVVVTAAEMLLLLAQSVNFVRNMLPVFPLMILLAAAGAVALADLVPRRPLRLVVLVSLAAALLVPQIQNTIWQLRYWSRPNTMTAAAQDLRALPRGMRSAVEMNPMAWAGDPIVFPVQQLIEHPLDWYRANGFRYLVTNNDHHGPDDQAAYARLLAEARIVVQYPERRAGIRPGPGGAILDLGDHPELMQFARREIRFGDVAELLGYEIKPGAPRSLFTPLFGAQVKEAHAGEPVQINLYWRALATMGRDYTLFLHVVDQSGAVVSQRDLPPRYGDYPMSHWRPGEMVVDRADMALPPLPAGAYRLEIGLYDAATGARLPAKTAPEDAGPPPTLTTMTIR